MTTWVNSMHAFQSDVPLDFEGKIPKHQLSHSTIAKENVNILLYSSCVTTSNNYFTFAV